MSQNHKNAIVLFARDPVVGQVKTRLHPFLDQETIFQLYTQFLNDSIRKICNVKNADCFIGVYPADLSGFFSRLKTDCSIEVFIQEGKDLGERMKNTFQARSKEGYHRSAIIGSDSPSLPVKYIETALASDKDLVLGPSTDGGYYLIGMGQKLVNVFAEGVTWGSEQVLAQTLDQLKFTACSLELLPPWYDVDRPEDLKFLQTHLDLMNHSGSTEAGSTAKFLRDLNFE